MTEEYHIVPQRSWAMSKFILGQMVIVGKYGYGRVTEIGPPDRCGRDEPEWVGVTPLVGSTWQMNFAPHNVVQTYHDTK